MTSATRSLRSGEPHSQVRLPVEYAGENNYDQISVDNTRPARPTTRMFVCLYRYRGGGATSKAAVANVALGIFDTYGEIRTRSYTPFRGNMYEIVGQDQWRVNSKLVLSMGIRYSIMMPYHSLWGNQAFFSPKDYNPALPLRLIRRRASSRVETNITALSIPGSGFPSAAKGHVPDSILNGNYQRLFRGYGSGYSPTVYSNIQPRFGFAYQIEPARSSVPELADTSSASASAIRCTSAATLLPAGSRRKPGQRGQPRRLSV